MRANWAEVFVGVPDFPRRAAAVGAGRRHGVGRVALARDPAGRHAAGGHGVTIFGVSDRRIVWGWLYLEEVEAAGQGIGEAVRQMAGQASQEEAT